MNLKEVRIKNWEKRKQKILNKITRLKMKAQWVDNEIAKLKKN